MRIAFNSFTIDCSVSELSEFLASMASMPVDETIPEEMQASSLAPAVDDLDMAVPQHYHVSYGNTRH
jgi:hypothetical protein